MSRFRLSPGGSRAHEPWFRVGTLDVGTTWLVVFGSVVGLFVYAVGRDNLERYLIFVPDSHWIAGHPWTLVTWPFALVSHGVLSAVIGVFFFWYFGRELESSVLGRSKMAWWLLVSTLGFAVVVWGLVELFPSWFTALYGGQFLGLAVALLWIAEWPHRMFMFSIPAWIMGLVFLAIEILQDVHDATWALLWGMLIGLALSGFAARQYGALSEYAWIPRLPGAGPRRPRTRRRKSAQNTVVAGPWDGTRPTHTPAPPPVNRDAQRMDELLDKISAHGTESLTATELRELEELRLRRRR